MRIYINSSSLNGNIFEKRYLPTVGHPISFERRKNNLIQIKKVTKSIFIPMKT